MRKLKRRAIKQVRDKKGKKARFAFLLNEANRQQDLLNFDLAEKAYKAALRIDPNNPELLTSFGFFLVKRKRAYKQAQLLFEKVVKLYPVSPTYYENLAKFYSLTNQWDLLQKISDSFLGRIKNNHIPLFYLGQSFRLKKKYLEGIDLLERAVKLSPTFDFAHVELCSIYEELGNKEKLRHQVDQLKWVLEKIDDKQKIININYAIGKYYDILDDYDIAFQYFKIANSLRLSNRSYDLSKDRNYLNRIKKNCGEIFIKNHETCGYVDDNLTPIFILGMPRSGTSLVEQVLSSHPLIIPAGELTDFYKLSTKYNFASPEHYQLHGYEYIKILNNIKSPSERYVTDKMPDNFQYAGLIKLSVPNAKIVHCLRDPMDTCFSCYKQGFTDGKLYSCDLETLGQYYLMYRDLMDHWQRIMPDFIYNVCYEDVVNNFEEEMRNVFTFCGLRWDSSCLKYYKSSRRVSTASRDQVTKPIYTSSVGRWKHYSKHLHPLSNVLKK